MRPQAQTWAPWGSSGECFVLRVLLGTVGVLETGGQLMMSSLRPRLRWRALRRVLWVAGQRSLLAARRGTALLMWWGHCRLRRRHAQCRLESRQQMLASLCQLFELRALGFDCDYECGM